MKRVEGGRKEGRDVPESEKGQLKKVLVGLVMCSMFNNGRRRKLPEDRFCFRLSTLPQSRPVRCQYAESLVRLFPSRVT